MGEAGKGGGAGGGKDGESPGAAAGPPRPQSPCLSSSRLSLSRSSRVSLHAVRAERAGAGGGPRGRAQRASRQNAAIGDPPPPSVQPTLPTCHTPGRGRERARGNTRTLAFLSGRGRREEKTEWRGLTPLLSFPASTPSPPPPPPPSPVHHGHRPPRPHPGRRLGHPPRGCRQGAVRAGQGERGEGGSRAHRLAPPRPPPAPPHRARRALPTQAGVTRRAPSVGRVGADEGGARPPRGRRGRSTLRPLCSPHPTLAHPAAPPSPPPPPPARRQAVGHGRHADHPGGDPPRDGAGEAGREGGRSPNSRRFVGSARFLGGCVRRPLPLAVPARRLSVKHSTVPAYWGRQ
jgi:hypothetical protein